MHALQKDGSEAHEGYYACNDHSILDLQSPRFLMGISLFGFAEHFMISAHRSFIQDAFIGSIITDLAKTLLVLITVVSEELVAFANDGLRAEI